MISASQEEEETLKWESDTSPWPLPPKIKDGEINCESSKCEESHCEAGSLRMKKMESNVERGAFNDGDLGTVESLRGRLLAQRQASRAAKETTEFMSSKLIELESKLKVEIKLRDKAERKLKLLKKKLQSLDISYTPRESDQCPTPENCDNPCGLAITDSVSKNSEDNEPKTWIARA